MSLNTDTILQILTILISITMLLFGPGLIPKYCKKFDTPFRKRLLRTISILLIILILILGFYIIYQQTQKSDLEILCEEKIEHVHQLLDEFELHSESMDSNENSSIGQKGLIDYYITDLNTLIFPSNCNDSTYVNRLLTKTKYYEKILQNL